MAFQIEGKIEWIGKVQSKPSRNGGQPFYSREFVLDATRYNPKTGEPWGNHPKFELSSQRVNIIDGFEVGQRVVVEFSLRGSKYPDQATGEMKYFTTISAFNITSAEQPQQSQYSSQSQPTFQQPAQNTQYAPQPQGAPFPPNVDNNGNPVKNEDDDLPF